MTFESKDSRSDIISYDELIEDFRDKRFEFFKNMCKFVDEGKIGYAIHTWKSVQLWLEWIAESQSNGSEDRGSRKIL